MMSLSVLLIASVSLASGGEKFYVARKEKRDWHDARRECECWGGDLATFSSPTEYALMEIAADASKLDDNVWVGLQGDYQGGWTFIQDAENPSFDDANKYCEHGDCAGLAQWAEHEPNNIGSEECTELRRDTKKLNNLPCREQHYYLCQFDRDNYAIGISRSDLEVPMPWIPAGRGPQPVEFGTYSAQDLMMVAMAVFAVINVVTLAVFCLRAKGAATVRYYSKVVADSDEDARLNA